MKPVLELRRIAKRYPASASGAVEVLREVNLVLETGASASVRGVSGCGKSTLLNIAGALDQPSGGTVLFEGQALESFSERTLAVLRNEGIGFVFQLHHLLPQCTALENVLIPALPRGIDSDVRSRAGRLLERVGLGDRVRCFPSQLSGGERQRVAVVRALINRPRLVLADEPTGALDADTADELAGLLLRLNREEGVALLLVTHDPLLADQMDTCYRLNRGILEADATPVRGETAGG